MFTPQFRAELLLQDADSSIPKQILLRAEVWYTVTCRCWHAMVSCRTLNELPQRKVFAAVDYCVDLRLLLSASLSANRLRCVIYNLYHRHRSFVFTTSLFLLCLQSDVLVSFDEASPRPLRFLIQIRHMALVQTITCR